MNTVTPGDLRAMRLLLGMSRDELARLLGTTADEMRTLERSRTHFVYEQHATMLNEMLSAVTKLIDKSLDRDPPRFLFTFPNDGAFSDYEPELASWMKLNSVHLMFTARLLDAWMANGHRPTVMEIVPAQYEEHLAKHGADDSESQRIGWANAHLMAVEMRPGGPRRQAPKDRS